MNITVEIKQYPASKVSIVEVKNFKNENSRVFKKEYRVWNEVSGLYLGADESNNWEGKTYKSYGEAKDTAQFVGRYYKTLS